MPVTMEFFTNAGVDQRIDIEVDFVVIKWTKTIEP